MVVIKKKHTQPISPS